MLYVLVFLGGMLTILSPCILPVLPFVLGRADRSFARETLPMLAGLVVTFALVAVAGVASAAWVARAADLGRWAALAFLGIAALCLLSPAIAERLARPAVLLGSRLHAGRGSASLSLAAGIATGLLWAPCAGPILGLVSALAAVGADPARAATLFATFGLGAAVSLTAVLLATGRALSVLRRLSSGDRWVRRGFGVAALATVLLIASGRDAELFARGGVPTASAEEALLHRLVPSREAVLAAARPAPVPTPDEGPLPSFAGATGWLNGKPIADADLRGKVVLVNVWTFACYNCLNALPYIKALEAKYRDRGLVVVGVHTPELARERIPGNVADAVRRLGVVYPVPLDNDYTIWNAFHNQYWPAVYIADKSGRIRFHHFGEGRYDDEERVVQQLLAEAAR